MKKNIFNNAYEIDYILIGIVSDIKEHKLAWLINQIFNFDLIKMKNLKIKIVKNKILEISNYMQNANDFNIRLIKNKLVRGINVEKEQYLIKKLSKFDYLMQIYDYNNKFRIDNIINNLNKESCIQFANFVDVKFVKERDLLLI